MNPSTDCPDPGPGAEKARIASLEDYRLLARASLPRDIFDYVDGGAGDEITMRRNRQDFDRLALLPFCLRDVSAPNLSTQVLGRSLPLPIGFSPTALQRLVHPDGEAAAARAAKSLNIPMIVSCMSSLALEKVAERSGHDNLWLQTYIFRDREITRQLVGRAEQAGFQAIVVTVGCPVPGKRDRNLRNRFLLPSDVSAANFVQGGRIDFNNPIHSVGAAEFDPSLTWRDVDWLRDLTALPIIAKGLINPCDAARAMELGLSGVIVSNHGGRQLDTTASTISVLPEFAEAVAGRISLFIDSGFRRGTDLLKALALGADCILLGRPVMWALAADGEQGVRSMVELLADELRVAMQLAGCQGIEQARRDAPLLLRQC